MQERQSMESHLKKYSKAPDEIWLSWLSCLVLAKRNSQASRPVNVATITIDSVSDVSRVTRGLAIRRAKKRVNLTNDKRKKIMLCRDLTAMRTRDCSFYVQLAMPSAQRRC